MRELSGSAYAEFKNNLNGRLAWTFRRKTKIKRIKEYYDSLESHTQAAISQSNFTDDTRLGRLIHKAISLQVEFEE